MNMDSLYVIKIASKSNIFFTTAYWFYPRLLHLRRFPSGKILRFFVTVTILIKKVMENAYKVLDIIKEIKVIILDAIMIRSVMLQRESMSLKTQLQIII